METGSIDDEAVTNNNDGQMVLATVASTLYVFTDKHPNIWIYATGSNYTRTRLYRMGIAIHLMEILKGFEVYGLIDNSWQPFEKGREYEAFLAKRKLS